MATFNVTDRVRIRGPDARNWVVEVLRESDPNHHLTRHPGREYWDVLGYHRSLEIAARQLLEVSGKLEAGEHEWRAVEAWIDAGARRIATAIREQGAASRRRRAAA